MGRLLCMFAVTAVMSGALGCGPPPKDPAVAAFEGLFGAMARGDAEKVYALLGPESRAALADGVGLDAEADAATVVERLAVRPGWTFIVDRGHRPRLDEQSSSDSRRIVIGSLSGRLQAIPVVRVDDGWRVELVLARPAPEAGG